MPLNEPSYIPYASSYPTLGGQSFSPDIRKYYVINTKYRRKIFKALCPSCWDMIFSLIEEGCLDVDTSLVRYICHSCFEKLVMGQLLIIKQAHFDPSVLPRYWISSGTILPEGTTSWVTT